MKVLFVDSAHPILAETLVKYGVECHHLELDRNSAKAILHQYDGVVIRSRFKFDKEMLDASKQLKCIARVGAGMENIDVQYAESLGIACLNAPEGNRNAVAEHALGMLLGLFNNLIRADREVREGKWLREENRGFEIEGKTVAIIGLGNNGSAFAKKLKGFDCRLIAYDPYLESSEIEGVELCTMDEIFKHADIVSLHVPLKDDTHFLVNKEWIDQFQKPFWIINTARGKCLKTSDLIDAINSGKIIGAALDVLEFEALSFEKADIAPEEFQWLIQSDKVILSPHIAGWTHESNTKLARILASKILANFNIQV
jgi:D-3-phosphoglycerate dehydrogenase